MTALLSPCLECGTPHGLRQNLKPATFCCAGCRRVWNNRRMVRGAELYDLLMAHRFERAEAQKLGVLPAINRLASIWRQEDKHQRSARRSWRPTREVMLDRPALKIMTTGIRAGR